MSNGAQVFLTAEYLAIAMGYAAGGDMYHRVVRCRGLPEDDARWYFQQLVIAIDYCHRMARRCAASVGLLLRARCLRPVHSARLLHALCIMDGKQWKASGKLTCGFTCFNSKKVFRTMPSHCKAKSAVRSLCRSGRDPLQGVANRDIKLENTLLDDSERPLLKICDFGYSKARATRFTCGRPGVLAGLLPCTPGSRLATWLHAEASSPGRDLHAWLSEVTGHMQGRSKASCPALLTPPPSLT